MKAANLPVVVSTTLAFGSILVLIAVVYFVSTHCHNRALEHRMLFATYKCKPLAADGWDVWQTCMKQVVDVELCQ